MSADPRSRGLDRESFMARVRRALETGGAPSGAGPDLGPVPRLPPDDPEEAVERFADEARAASATVSRVADLRELRGHLLQMATARGCTWVARADTPLLQRLEADVALRDAGVSVVVAHADAARDELRGITEQAEIGWTEADAAIAETGTLALFHRPGQGRAVSLLPPIHVAILPVDRIVPDLAALIETLPIDELPSAVTFVTGPSRTADIEMVITRGVHGPAELHVVLVDAV